MLEKFFKLKENRTDVKTEIMAGITTFMTMAYILAVNPSILSAAGMDAKMCIRDRNSIMLGGDAFITKPYNVAILLARIASLLKRACPSGEAEVLEHRGLCLYPESGRKRASR